MERYLDRNGNSGVRAYELGDDFIAVRFADGWIYYYTNIRPGAHHVATMQRLAVSGSGLNSYINRHVRYSYARKSRF